MPSIDSLLNDYLDDRLDSDTRRRVEAALEVDECLRRSLQALAEVRDLVAGLSRTKTVDVAPRVMAAIAVAGKPPARVLDRSWGWGFRIAATISLAAGLLLFVGTALVERHFQVDGRPLAAIAPWRANGSGDHRADSASMASRSPSLEVAQRVDSPGDRNTIGAHHRGQHDQSLIRRFLGERGAQRVIQIEGSNQVVELVAQVIARTTSRSFLKLDMGGKSAGDLGQHSASIFVVAVPEGEIAVLRERLRADLGDRSLRESAADPRLVDRLAAAATAQTVDPVPSASVAIPQGSLALRYTPLEVDPFVDPPSPERRRPTPQQFQSAPLAHPPLVDPEAPLDVAVDSAGEISEKQVQDRPGGQAEPDAKSKSKVVVLVWITRSQHP